MFQQMTYLVIVFILGKMNTFFFFFSLGFSFLVQFSNFNFLKCFSAFSDFLSVAKKGMLRFPLSLIWSLSIFPFRLLFLLYKLRLPIRYSTFLEIFILFVISYFSYHKIPLLIVVTLPAIKFTL